MWGALAKRLAVLIASKKSGKKSKSNGGIKGVVISILVILFLIIAAVMSGVMQPLKLAQSIYINIVSTGLEVGAGVVKDISGNVVGFATNMGEALWGDEDDNDTKTTKEMQRIIDSYSLEDMIKAVDDEDIITDDTLETMMIDRASLKKLLQAIYKSNHTYSSTTKRIQVKKTYTTTEVQSLEDIANSAAKKSSTKTKKSGKKKIAGAVSDPFAPKATATAKPYDVTVPNANSEPSASPVPTNSSQEVETNQEEVKKVQHTDYEWKTLYVSHKDVEGQYEMYWQPILLSTMQSCLKNFGELSGVSSGDSSNSNSTSTQEGTNSSKNNTSTNSVDTSTEGGEIAAYGLGFLGNPYVYGGSSLTNGCDCSGFVMKVYEHFGYSLPHSSSLMRTVGKRVCDKDDYAQSLLQEGDIICYEGHVGIYIGNGKIVNASNEKVGIVTYNIMYRNDLVTVRRVADGTGQKKVSTKTTKKATKSSVAVKKGSINATSLGSIPVSNVQTMSVAKTATSKATKKTTKNKTKASASPSPSASTNPYEGADKKLQGNDVPSKMWNYFKAKELSDINVAAILGNCQQESNFNVNSSSGSFHGLFQWGENKDSQRWAALKKKYPGGEYDLLNQLNYAWWEMSSADSGRKSTLPLLSHSQHLDYINVSDKGAVWIFAYYFEGCVSSTQPYGIQEYKERLTYANNWLKKFGGKDGAVTDGKVYNAGDVGLDEVSSSLLGDRVYGTYDKETGLVTLSDADIADIIEDFKPSCSYDFDIVESEKDSYTFDECKEMKNNGLENDGGDISTEEGLSEWYTPTSTIISVQLPYGDVTYDGNIPSKYEYNTSRWTAIMDRYVAFYDEAIFLKMTETLPNGSEFSSVYEYFKSLSNGTSASTPENNQNISNADGDYEGMDEVSPSIKIPSTAGGMSIPLYLQTDKRWSNVKFGGNTISTSGCSVTSLAMVLSYMKQKCIYPDDVVDWTGAKTYYAGSAGASWTIFGAVAKHWGLNCTQQTVDANAIIKALKAGNPVIVSTSGNGTTQEFTKGGHFILLRGLNSKGQVLVNDPNDNSTTKNHYLKAYSAAFIVSECTQAGIKKPMWIFTK